jgi:hypothetical protein
MTFATKEMTLKIETDHVAGVLSQNACSSVILV